MKGMLQWGVWWVEWVEAGAMGQMGLVDQVTTKIFKRLSQLGYPAVSIILSMEVRIWYSREGNFWIFRLVYFAVVFPLPWGIPEFPTFGSTS